MKHNTKYRDTIFLELLRNAEIPEPVAEYRFHEDRKWRFDFAFPEQKIAIEIEGGLWNQGRHNRPASMIKDMEKYNEAAILGWRVLRFEPGQLRKRDTIEMIKEAFQLKDKSYMIEERIF